MSIFEDFRVIVIGRRKKEEKSRRKFNGFFSFFSLESYQISTISQTYQDLRNTPMLLSHLRPASVKIERNQNKTKMKLGPFHSVLLVVRRFLGKTGGRTQSRKRREEKRREERTNE